MKMAKMAAHNIAIINVVNFYVDMPDVVKQFGTADAKDPTLEGYVYEAMRKETQTSL